MEVRLPWDAAQAYFVLILPDPHKLGCSLAVDLSGRFFHNHNRCKRWQEVKRPHLTLKRALVYGKLAQAYETTIGDE